jgi:thiol-disulfide isomerase/thioredoxin
MTDTNTPSPRPDAPDRHFPVRKVLLILLGLIAIGVGMVGVWYAVGPRGDALMPEAPLRAGSDRVFKLTAHASPRAIANVDFEDGQGRKRTLADFRGKVVLLNIWATWCGPCRKEMPTLDRLQQRLGGPGFEVVALSIDRGGQAAVKSFFDEIDVKALAIYVDPTTDAQAKLDIIGVPTTLLLNREGREVARYVGPAEWDRPEVIEFVERYLMPRKS